MGEPTRRRRRRKVDWAAVEKSVTQKLLRRFPIGAQVRMSRNGEGAFPRYKWRIGTVVGYFNGVSPKILFDGRKTADSYAWCFLTVIKGSRRHVKP